MMPLIPSLFAIALYLLASILLLMRLVNPAAAGSNRRISLLMIGLAAVLIHGVMLYPAIITAAGLNLGFFHAASLIALLTAFLLVLAAFCEPVENLGIAVFPVAAASIGFMLLFPDQHIVGGESMIWQFDAHILISLLAYSILGLAFLQALLFAVQDYHLRNRQPGGFIRSLPPLQTMESLLFQMIGTGFALLTLALVTGVLFLEDIFAQHLVHKTILSVSAWAIFATLLWGRWRYGWRSRTAIRWTIGGFVFLILAYFGSKLVLELILGR